MTTAVAEDTINGGYLDATRVKNARDEEIRWILGGDFVDPVPRIETTSKPITLKWVDTNKADDLNPNYKSRLVQRDLKARKTDDG